LIADAKRGEIKQKLEMGQSIPNPLIAVSPKGKCIVSLPKSNEGVFFDPERGVRKPTIKFDPTK
jgi:hypothetical protein